MVKGIWIIWTILIEVNCAGRFNYLQLEVLQFKKSFSLFVVQTMYEVIHDGVEKRKGADGCQLVVFL